MPLGLKMVPLEYSVSRATMWSVTLELSITILEVSFGYCNMFTVQATETNVKNFLHL